MRAKWQARDNRLVFCRTLQRACLAYSAPPTSVPFATPDLATGRIAIRSWKIKLLSSRVSSSPFTPQVLECVLGCVESWYQSLGGIERKSPSTVPMNQSYSLGYLFNLAENRYLTSGLCGLYHHLRFSSIDRVLQFGTIADSNMKVDLNAIQ